MENLSTLTGFSNAQIETILREIIVECVMNSKDLEMAQRHISVLNAVADSLK